MFSGATVIGTILAVITFTTILGIFIWIILGGLFAFFAFAIQGVKEFFLALVVGLVVALLTFWLGSLWIHWIIGLANDWASLAN